MIFISSEQKEQRFIFRFHSLSVLCQWGEEKKFQPPHIHCVLSHRFSVYCLLPHSTPLATNHFFSLLTLIIHSFSCSSWLLAFFQSVFHNTKNYPTVSKPRARDFFNPFFLSSYVAKPRYISLCTLAFEFFTQTTTSLIYRVLLSIILLHFFPLFFLLFLPLDPHPPMLYKMHSCFCSFVSYSLKMNFEI